ncbi:TPA: hypothetical protein O6E10_001000 [Vibrio cholerae]|nr:hypothetical protein [Vibrio cholerae]
MNKKEYIIRQLSRTKNKKYEAYVIHRIVNLINDFGVKFITQQYVSRPNGFAMTDLFFPQFNLHVEVDEGQHFSFENIEKDKIREADIVNATGHELLRVDVTKSFENINIQIDEVVKKIIFLKSKDEFVPWDMDLEFEPETYIKKGYISVADNVAFRTIKDACNCFGHNYKGYQKAGASHPEIDTMLWFPKLYKNGEWDNQISGDEEIIKEKAVNNEIAREHVVTHIEQLKGEKHKRIVFARVKGNLGDILYRFRGLYELDKAASSLDKGLVWKRTSSKVKTFQ